MVALNAGFLVISSENNVEELLSNCWESDRIKGLVLSRISKQEGLRVGSLKGVFT